MEGRRIVMGKAGVEPRAHIEIRIAKVPAGEAPFWVRRAWLGIKLFAYDIEEKMCGDQIGSLGSKAEEENQGGYLVFTYDAIVALEKHNKEAAVWWKQNPLLKNHEFLRFGKKYCEIVK